MKIYLVAVGSFLTGYIMCRVAYTEKVLESYDMGWRDAKKEYDETVKGAAASMEDPPDEEALDAAEDEVAEVTVEAAKTLIDHVGYDQYSKTPDRKGPKLKRPKPLEVTTDNTVPTVITQQTFFDHGLETQYQITYYAGDDVLVGQSGGIIEADARITGIGVDTLSQFGVDSGDEDVVYVRNLLMDRGKGIDFEITRDWGKYADNMPPGEADTEG